MYVWGRPPKVAPGKAESDPQRWRLNLAPAEWSCMLSESEVKFAFSLQYSKFYAMGGRTRTLPLWHGPNQANAEDS
jgi:hypothetical protein